MPYKGMANYRIIPDTDGDDAFRVEIAYPSGHLKVIAGFKTEEAAQAWIVDLKAWNATAQGNE
jgi:hypothetical protein